MTRQMLQSLIYDMNNCNATIFRCLKGKSGRNDTIPMEDIIRENIDRFERNLLEVSRFIAINRNTREWLLGKVSSLKGSYPLCPSEMEEQEEDFTRIVAFLKEHSKEYSKE